ncbi:hypothetical protein UFOVP275_61 [uncultured Caudovirales phage]|uniref:Uncharacterized protein n=1 Tax=uncultured Caudovirales phage TaxID=2100421 RepID=A0A6J5LTN6_9CAUD|nr:hypothetical protein UFOVP275_61 [uncultured Caudovirales phage]
MNTSPSLLERCHKFIDQNGSFVDESENLLKDLEAAIAEQAKPRQEPVVLITAVAVGGRVTGQLKKGADAAKIIGKKLYARPQAREPMSEDEMDKLAEIHMGDDGVYYSDFARAIEAHHGIK